MNPNYYQKQKDRAVTRKYELVALRGGKCEICGYDKNYGAFDFHHLNPTEKEFQLDSRHLSNTNIEDLMKEADKCILLCANCHREAHYPDLEKNLFDERYQIIKNDHVSIHNKNKRRQAVCEVCGKEYNYAKGKRYCSIECNEKAKNYPTFKQIVEKYEELNSWQKVAKYFGITRKITQGIRLKEAGSQPDELRDTR